MNTLEQLLSQSKSIQARTQFTQELRQELVSRFPASQQSLQWSKWALAILIAALFIGLTGTGVVAAAHQSKPGQILYPLKVYLETQVSPHTSIPDEHLSVEVKSQPTPTTVRHPSITPAINQPVVTKTIAPTVAPVILKVNLTLPTATPATIPSPTPVVSVQVELPLLQPSTTPSPTKKPEFNVQTNLPVIGDVNIHLGL